MIPHSPKGRAGVGHLWLVEPHHFEIHSANALSVPTRMHTLLRAEGFRVCKPRGHCPAGGTSWLDSRGVQAALSLRDAGTAALSETTQQAVSISASGRMLGARD